MFGRLARQFMLFLYGFSCVCSLHSFCSPIHFMFIVAPISELIRSTALLTRQLPVNFLKGFDRNVFSQITRYAVGLLKPTPFVKKGRFPNITPSTSKYILNEVFANRPLNIWDFETDPFCPKGSVFKHHSITLGT